MKIIFIATLLFMAHTLDANAIDPSINTLVIGNIKIRNSTVAGNISRDVMIDSAITASSDNAPESDVLGDDDECENLSVLMKSLSGKTQDILGDDIDKCENSGVIVQE